MLMGLLFVVGSDLYLDFLVLDRLVVETEQASVTVRSLTTVSLSVKRLRFLGGSESTYADEEAGL